jgi:putative hydrolase of the HAD superfamily
VLFDLGGVLVELRGVASMRELSGLGDDDELWHRWLSCPWVRAFERGGCSAEQFAVGLVEEWRLPVSPEAFLAEFSEWPVGPFPGAIDLVREVRAVVPVGCLSNTNTLHWESRFAHWPMMELFDFHLLSFELGALKPDPEMFDLVAAALPATRSTVLFLDDVQLNVDAAEAAGLQAARARGVAEARAVLADAGVLPAAAGS